MYVNFFQPTLKAGEKREFTVMMVNDEHRPQKGTLTLSLSDKATGRELVRSSQPFEIDALGNKTFKLSLTVPPAAGECTVRAAAQADGEATPTLSRRWVKVEK